MTKITKKSYIATVGRRKTAVARIRLVKKGTGKIVVNDQEYEKYFSTSELRGIVAQPLDTLNLLDKVDLSIKVTGGGTKSQAESIRLGIARSLVKLDEENKPKLKKPGFLKRDPRKKERKKPGLKRARRAPQWSKR